MIGPMLAASGLSLSPAFLRPSNFRGGEEEVKHFLRTVLRGAWTELHQTWSGHRAITAALKICFIV